MLCILGIPYASFQVRCVCLASRPTNHSTRTGRKSGQPVNSGVGRQKHVALHRRLASADFRILEQPWLCVGLLNPPTRDVEILALTFDADELQTHPGAGKSSCPAAHLGVKNSARVSCLFNAPLHQANAFLCRVVRAFVVPARRPVPYLRPHAHRLPADARPREFAISEANL